MEPLGWWGTIPGWARAIGLTFAALELLLILSCLRRLKREGMASGLRERLIVALGLLPLAVVFAAYSYAIPASMKVEACGACHDMEPFVKDLGDPKSENLAAIHHQNNVAKGQECYACHSDYGLWGDVHAKFEGLGHIWHQTMGSYTLPIKIRKPYPNSRCLSCHGGTRRFVKQSAHADAMKAIESGETRCLDCHSSIHPPPETRGPAVPAAQKKTETTPEEKK